MWVLVRKRERISLLLARGRSRGLFLNEDFKDRAEVIRAKAKLRHLARRDKCTQCTVMLLRMDWDVF